MRIVRAPDRAVRYPLRRNEAVMRRCCPSARGVVDRVLDSAGDRGASRSTQYPANHFRRPRTTTRLLRRDSHRDAAPRRPGFRRCSLRDGVRRPSVLQPLAERHVYRPLCPRDRPVRISESRFPDASRDVRPHAAKLTEAPGLPHRHHRQATRQPRADVYVRQSRDELQRSSQSRFGR